jgi:lipopolysaccharide export LptBFGC system permease protein LptF
MKRLQLYVLRDVLKALVPAFSALVLIMLVGFCMQLLHEGLDVVRLRHLLGPLVAYCVPMVLPSAFLTAVVMTFGRLSADNELIGIRAAGIHLLSVIGPVLVAALVLSSVAAYFQFELVPRARATVEDLRLTALKQILLDRVVLSARRHFVFPDAFIMYDDFVDGRLSDVVVVTKQGAHPADVFTAASAVVRTDSADPDVLLFGLEEPLWTPIGPGTLGGTTETRTKAERMEILLSLVPRRSPLADEKFLPTPLLLRRLSELRAKVAGHERLQDPGRKRKDMRRQLHQVAARAADVGRTLEQARENHHKYAVLEPQEAEHARQAAQERVLEVRRELSDLRGQLKTCTDGISEAQSSPSGAADFDRLVALEDLRRTLQQQIDARDAGLAALAGEVEQAVRALERSAQRAAQYGAELEAVQAEKDRLDAQRDALYQEAAKAEAQYDLRSAWLRVHKRLAQAASLFIFALVGIPLGIMVGGRSVMVAFGISFAIVLAVFYPFLVFGQIAAEAGRVPVGAAMWAGNGFVGLIGLLLMARVVTH